MGSATKQGRPAARAGVAGRVAFRSGDGVGALIANFRSSIPSPSFPLFTLHWTLHSARCKTRGRVDRYSFLVRLFHPQLHAGLSRRTTTFFSRHGLKSWWSNKIRMDSRPMSGASLRFTASSATRRTVHRAHRFWIRYRHCRWRISTVHMGGRTVSQHWAILRRGPVRVYDRHMADTVHKPSYYVRGFGRSGAEYNCALEWHAVGLGRRSE